MTVASIHFVYSRRDGQAEFFCKADGANATRTPRTVSRSPIPVLTGPDVEPLRRHQRAVRLCKHEHVVMKQWCDMRQSEKEVTDRFGLVHVRTINWNARSLTFSTATTPTATTKQPSNTTVDVLIVPIYTHAQTNSFTCYFFATGVAGGAWRCTLGLEYRENWQSRALWNKMHYNMSIPDEKREKVFWRGLRPKGVESVD